MATGQQPVGSSDHEVSHFHVHHLDFPETVLGTQIAAPAFCSTIFSRPPNRLLLSTAWWFESLQTEILVFGRHHHHHHHHLNFTGPETYHLSNSSNHKPVGVSLSKVVSLVDFFSQLDPRWNVKTFQAHLTASQVGAFAHCSLVCTIDGHRFSKQRSYTLCREASDSLLDATWSS